MKIENPKHGWINITAHEFWCIRCGILKITSKAGRRYFMHDKSHAYSTNEEP